MIKSSVPEVLEDATTDVAPTGNLEKVKTTKPKPKKSEVPRKSLQNLLRQKKTQAQMEILRPNRPLVQNKHYQSGTGR